MNPRIRDDETCWCGVPLDFHDDIRLVCGASPHPADCWPPQPETIAVTARSSSPSAISAIAWPEWRPSFPS